MSFKLVVTDTVTVPVEGSIANAEGVFLPFSFDLICDRLPTDQLDAAVAEKTLPDMMKRVTKGWNRVVGEDNAPVSFSPEGLAQAFSVIGVEGIALASYLKMCGAKGKEKN